MDAKITLSFNREVIERAKKFADSHKISLSRLTEMLYEKLAAGNYKNLEELPVSDWVSQVAEGPVEYKKNPSSRKSLKSGFYKSRK